MQSIPGHDPNAPVVTGGFGGAKIDSSQQNGTSVANGARWKWMASMAARRSPADVFHGHAPYFAKSSGPKICRISMVSPSSAGQRCAHFTTSSFDGASTSQ
jgi:hypothetical protein